MTLSGRETLQEPQLRLSCRPNHYHLKHSERLCWKAGDEALPLQDHLSLGSNLHLQQNLVTVRVIEVFTATQTENLHD